MCMLYGFSGSRKYELNKSLEEFFSHSKRHPHGWGLGIYYEKNESPVIMKQSTSASKSSIVKNLVKGSIPGKVAVGHIRYATMGEKSFVNTHPFVQEIMGKEWTFAHNGSIKVDEIANSLYITPQGETDSEMIFCYIIQNIVEDEDTIESIEKSIEKLSKYGKLNLIFTDGEYMYIHTNYENSLFVYEDKELACFSTKPLTNTATYEKWASVPLNRLLVYKNGKIIYEGKIHNNQYYKVGKIDYSEGIA